MDRFTEEQIREFEDAFCMFCKYDKQNNGYILSTELREMLKIVGFNPTDSTLETLTILIDEDGNGRIEFTELVDLIDKLETQEKALKEARDSFNAFDFLGEGFVAANDLKEALFYIMEKASEEDKQNIVKHFKLEKNRKIEFEEFKEMIIMKK
ncbi:calmodulin-like protein 3 isoform X1 [Clytia hemisphaerica]|uniref:EF-hand domain-containing protein n=1 Tax=Clytia hemisphaerica TaxID=252671 RepID=A0A7M5V0P6_9CNID|eukprot:TCONS_00003356-protein